LIEVKLSDKKIVTGIDTGAGQDRWLRESRIVEFLAKKWEPLEIEKLVLYRGPTDAKPNEDGIRWVNVEEWLLTNE
jgi:hypothetical protein